jgi:hypothetical protein
MTRSANLRRASRHKPRRFSETANGLLTTTNSKPHAQFRHEAVEEPGGCKRAAISTPLHSRIPLRISANRRLRHKMALWYIVGDRVGGAEKFGRLNGRDAPIRLFR